jgi:hypothetical protein
MAAVLTAEAQNEQLKASVAVLRASYSKENRGRGQKVEKLVVDPWNLVHCRTIRPQLKL